MQISSVITSQLATAARSTPATVRPSSMDQAVLNHSADSFAQYVDAAKQMPEVRTEVVDAFKARVQMQHYPAQELVEGLTRLIGASIVQQSRSSSSS